MNVVFLACTHNLVSVSSALEVKAGLGCGLLFPDTNQAVSVATHSSKHPAT